MNETVVEKFFSKIDTAVPPPEGEHYAELGNCHIWKGARFNCGYGAFFAGREVQTTRAHIVALVLSGRIIKEGEQVLHKCDVKTCVNPEHLYTGTHQQNMDDGKARKRFLSGVDNPSHKNPENIPRGENTVQSKLTDEKVLEIRRLYVDENQSQPKLSKMFGVSHCTIGFVVRGKIWKHLLPDGFKPQGYKGRRQRGEDTPHCVLNDVKVREIRQKYSEGGHTQRSLARDFNVSPSTIASILQGRTWTHVV